MTGQVDLNAEGYKVIGWNFISQHFSELDLSGSTATFTDVFDFGSLADRSPVGNPLYTTNSKFITISINKSTGLYYLTQFTYPSGTIENDININDSAYNPVGLIMPTCNCTCSLYVLYVSKLGSGARLIKKVNLTTGVLTLISQTIGSAIDISRGAAQLPSCTSCPMGIIPTTTTTSTTTTSTTTSTTSTSTTTTSTTVAPELVYFAEVYDCSLPAPQNCISTGVTKVASDTPGNPLTLGAFYAESVLGPSLGLIYEIKGLTSGPANVNVSDLTSYPSCGDACGGYEEPPA